MTPAPCCCSPPWSGASRPGPGVSSTSTRASRTPGASQVTSGHYCDSVSWSSDVQDMSTPTPPSRSSFCNTWTASRTSVIKWSRPASTPQTPGASGGALNLTLWGPWVPTYCQINFIIWWVPSLNSCHCDKLGPTLKVSEQTIRSPTAIQSFWALKMSQNSNPGPRYIEVWNTWQYIGTQGSNRVKENIKANIQEFIGILQRLFAFLRHPNVLSSMLKFRFTFIDPSIFNVNICFL